ncbi:hypothetical protein PMZ80_005995 [Knufia obscura]|uniref:Inositol polyphosphate-related phosphatase domain-containing protein n=1 Tax=Knufia obscura TaxID=1635080 RepID=A0ABR0RN79_9EURO|nr:hypothetical protein PMZ80_005995 [Knufia obscura]
MVDLKLYIVTFNCGRILIEPDAFGSHLFDGWEDPTFTRALPDVVVLNLQEIAPLSYAFLGKHFVRPYFDRFRQAVQVATQNQSAGGDDDSFKYFNVLSRHVGLTGIMLFVRDDLVDEIQTLNVAEVGVGLSEMGNKGAIGARLGWKSSDVEGLVYTTFVSAHLAPFEEEIERRNQDYVDIVSRMVFTSEDAREWRKDQQTVENVPLLAGETIQTDNGQATTNVMYSNDTYLFFAGDLNYRTALTTPGREDSEIFPQPRKNVKDALHYSHLLEKDQLTQQLQQGKTLHGLTEQRIDFPPTYKYRLNKDHPVLTDQDMEEWTWAQHRWPSWCDRILYSATQVKAGKYSALPLFRTSDHRPVALSVSIPLKRFPPDSELARQAPGPIDQHFKSRRKAARQKEIVVGVAAYLGLTWEGNALLLSTFLIVVGSIWISGPMS